MASVLDFTQGVLDYVLGQAGPYGFGSASTAAQVAEHYANNIRGRVFFVTGCTSGMGRETAFVLAKHGGIVVMASRSKAKLEDTQAHIQRTYPNAITHILECDLSSQRSVSDCLRDFQRLNLSGLNALICNGGVAFTKWSLAPDVHVETQFATNYLGHFALCLGLLPELSRTGTPLTDQGGGTPARIILVSSVLHKVAYYPQGIRLKDLSGEQYYEPIEAYGQSKLAMLLFMHELDRRIKERGMPITVNALHPGPVSSSITRHFIAWGLSSPLYMAYTKLLGKSVPQGAATHVFLAAAPEVKDISGKYWVDCRPEPYWHPALDTHPKLGQELWEASRRLTHYDM